MNISFESGGNNVQGLNQKGKTESNQKKLLEENLQPHSKRAKWVSVWARSNALRIATALQSGPFYQIYVENKSRCVKFNNKNILLHYLVLVYQRLFSEFSEQHIHIF